MIFYLFLPIAFFIASLFSIFRLLLPPLPDQAHPAFAQIEQMAGLIVVPGALLFSTAASLITIRYFLNLSGKGRWGQHPERLAQAAYYDTRSAHAPQMLVLRGVDDEAGFALTAGALGSRLSFLFVTKWIPRLFFRAAFGLLSLVFVAWILGEGQVAGGGYLWLMYVLSIWLVILIALPGVFKSVFGKELLFGSLRCEIAVDSGPDGDERIEVLTLSSNPVRVSSPFSLRDIPFATSTVGLARRLMGMKSADIPVPEANLRHAIYDDSRTPQYIANWIMRTAAQATPS